MKISIRKIISEPELEDIKSLYLTTFPPAERREYFDLIQQLYNDECTVNLILADQKVAGFIISWDFEEFVFIEHFAVKPKFRGLGIGEQTLDLIKKNYHKLIALEIEPPTDVTSKRRLNFYLRNGFHLINRKYFQPSYDGIKPEIEMKLMSTSANISSEKLDEYIQEIRKKVYKTFLE